MTDRILEWLRLQHDDPGLRTERGIAAMLEMERNGVRLGLYALKREGKIFRKWIDAKEAWFADAKRG